MKLIKLLTKGRCVCLSEMVDNFLESKGLQKPLPDLHGRCDCGYLGYFKFQSVQKDAIGRRRFNLYNCPKCKTMLSDKTIINNLYKSND